MRSFLHPRLHQVLILAVAFAFSGRPGPCAAPDPAENVFFAMDTAIDRIPGTLESRLDVLQRLGYAGLSFKASDPTEVRRIAAAAHARKLKLFALYISCPVTTTGLELADNFDQLCAAAGESETLIWFYTEKSAYRPSDASGDETAVPAFQSAADRAAKHNVKLALYPHRDYWVEKFADGVRVAGKVDRPNFGVSFNLCHALSAGEEALIPDLIRRAGSRLFIATINGADSGAAGAGWDRLIRPLGQGTYNPAPLLNLLRDIDYRGPVGFQAFAIKGDQTEILSETMTAWVKLQKNNKAFTADLRGLKQ